MSAAAEVKARANALRDHWNKVKATKGNPGDGFIGNLIGALLESVDALPTEAAPPVEDAIRDPLSDPPRCAQCTNNGVSRNRVAVTEVERAPVSRERGQAGEREMKTPTKFVAHVTVQHFAVEISPALLCWMDSGGTKIREANIDDASDERSAEIMAAFCAIPGIRDRDIEYNGHFGPYFYYACDAEDSERVGQAVIALLQKTERRMRRTKAYKEAQQLGVGPQDALESLRAEQAQTAPEQG